MVVFFDISFMKSQLVDPIFLKDKLKEIELTYNYFYKSDKEEKKMFFEWMLKRFFNDRGFTVSTFPYYEDYDFLYRNFNFSIQVYFNNFFKSNNFDLNSYLAYNYLVSLLVSDNTLILSLEEK